MMLNSSGGLLEKERLLENQTGRGRLIHVGPIYFYKIKKRFSNILTGGAVV